MSDIDAARNQVTGWLQPLADEAAPSGPDLEYDNEFLAVVQAAAGKPESQFGPAEAPDWRAVVEGCEALFERSRDLRIAILWLRATVHTLGWGALVPGLALVSGLVESSWDTVHPLPDPDDGDPYARVNALTLLRENEGLIGDLRDTRIIAERSVGELTGRAVEVALGLSPARSGESDLGKVAIAQMLQAAVGKQPELGAQCREAAQQVRALIGLLNDKLGVASAPDLRPLDALVAGVVTLLPGVGEGAAEEVAAEGDAQPAGAAAASRRGLSGAVTSREEALRAIDMVCEYLERAEPTNPAPLFLRRARQLVSHNFLQLMKVLAPDALAEVARVVGVDPDSVETPDGS
ncbi:MAG: type VI secretion system protein TssA [Burkholderiales bacterium]|nr:type VI secretion system protein TssA [Burkholderiales bacterium]